LCSAGESGGSGGSGKNIFVGELKFDECRVGLGNDRFFAGLLVELDIPRTFYEGCLVIAAWVAWRRVQWVDLFES